MEAGVTIAKVPDWMVLKPEMIRHLIREHEKVGRTLPRKRPSRCYAAWDSKSVSRSDEEQRLGSGGGGAILRQRMGAAKSCRSWVVKTATAFPSDFFL